MCAVIMRYDRLYFQMFCKLYFQKQILFEKVECVWVFHDLVYSCMVLLSPTIVAQGHLSLVDTGAVTPKVSRTYHLIKVTPITFVGFDHRKVSP